MNSSSNNLINFKVVGNDMITNPLQFPINSTDDITKFLNTTLIPGNLPILTDNDTLNYVTKETLESLINSLTQLLISLPVFPARPALEWTKNVENAEILNIIDDYIKNCQHLNEEAHLKESTKRAEEISKLFDEKLKNLTNSAQTIPPIIYAQPPPPPPTQLPLHTHSSFHYSPHQQFPSSYYQCQCQYTPTSPYCYYHSHPPLTSVVTSSPPPHPSPPPPPPPTVNPTHTHQNPYIPQSPNTQLPFTSQSSPQQQTSQSSPPPQSS